MVPGGPSGGTTFTVDPDSSRILFEWDPSSAVLTRKEAR
jgi:hypothetical protein